MKKLIINTNPEAAAMQFAEIITGPFDKEDFEIIPSSIGVDPTFWATLVEKRPELIAKVPTEIRKKKDFCDKIDHIKFYHYIPEELLTIEELDQHKADPEKAIYAKGSPCDVNTHDTYVWYQFNGSKYWFRNPDAITVFNRMIDYIADGEKLCPELWSQELADIIAESGYFFHCSDKIPQEFVRDEWRKLLCLYERRIQIMGKSPSIEKLPEYWGSFKTATEMEEAMDLEVTIKECVNPRGYAVQIEIGGSDEDSIENSAEHFKKLWDAIEPVVSSSEELVKEFFDFYGPAISRFIPDNLFNLDWIKDSDWFKGEYNIYRLYKRKLDKADSPVAIESAKYQIKDTLDFMVDTIKDFRPVSDAEAEELVKKFIGEE